MRELDEIREELDELRNRVVVLEFDKNVIGNTSVDAKRAARSAERQVIRSGSQLREIVENLEAGMAQIISLLTSDAACLPARRPENTQSASESPLT